MRRAALLFLFALLAGCGPAREERIVVGSKNFTEQVVLGELLAQHLENRTGLTVERRFYLTGSYICHQSLRAGRIDLYVEYTGTALTALLKEKPEGNPREVFARVRQAYAERFGLEVTEPLGFENTFAIVVRGEDAPQFNLKTLSQAPPHTPGWRARVRLQVLEGPGRHAGPPPRP